MERLMTEISFFDLLTKAVSAGASDLHISAGVEPLARIHGELTPIMDTKMIPAQIEAMTREFMTPEQVSQLKEKGEIDFAYSMYSIGRFRLNAFTQRGSYAICARVLNMSIPSPEKLGLPEAVVDLCKHKRGLVLVTGVTGSGKSTTLASLINEINQNENKHILTLEDPVEYLHSHKKSLVNQREVGSDSKSFPAALRAALRQDPDIILVGEMRDLETIAIAVTAAETGHLVFSTLHTLGAMNSIDRIIDVFPQYQQQQIRTQLAEVLVGVVSQQLVPSIDGTGRVGAFEVMLTNSAIRNHIREGKTFQIPSVMQTNAKVGMVTMDDALLNLYEDYKITAETAVSYAQDKMSLAKRLV